ncbi:hypothetical protein DYI20_11715 [Auritidibacter ignavus]|nr:hypothetical protein DYI20_11715 [Auritidibacter ignavus]
MPRGKKGTHPNLEGHCPDVAAEWDEERNGFPASECYIGAALKAWWKCTEHGRAWAAYVISRVKGAGCPYCAGRKALPGFNDLELRFPEIAKEWHPTWNGDTRACDVIPGTTKNYWWRCLEHGHTWKATPSNRTRNGTKCPYCTGSKAWPGFNDLETLRPDLAKQWNTKKNGGRTPDTVTMGSKTKFWWTCDLGHDFKMHVYRRSRGGGCYYCSNQKLLKGFNDLETKRPDLLPEWDYEKNNKIGLHPTTVSPHSHKKAWWKCSKGHSYDCTIGNRSNGKGTGCPYCSNKRILIGFNDLETTDPVIAAQWHPTLNGDDKPTDVTRGSSQKKRWWECPDNKEHIWKATPAQRTGVYYGQGCPECSSRRASNIEADLRERLTSGPLGLPNAKRKLRLFWRKKTYMEVDFLGQLGNSDTRIVVEYDGEYWHSKKGSFERDADKNPGVAGCGIPCRPDPGGEASAPGVGASQLAAVQPTLELRRHAC